MHPKPNARRREARKPMEPTIERPQYDLQRARAGGYARLAERHWRQHRPAWVAELERTGRLGPELLRAETAMLEALHHEMTKLRESGALQNLPFSERVQRENWARESIEERLLTEILLLPPEPAPT